MNYAVLLPRPFLSFIDAMLLPWAYDIVPADAPYPEAFGGHQIVVEIMDPIFPLLPKDWLDELIDRMDAPEVMYG